MVRALLGSRVGCSGGHEQEEEQGRLSAHHAEQKAARPVGLLVRGASPLHQTGGPQAAPRGQIETCCLRCCCSQRLAITDRPMAIRASNAKPFMSGSIHAQGPRDHGDGLRHPMARPGDEPVVPAQVGAEPGSQTGCQTRGGGIEQGQQG